MAAETQDQDTRVPFAVGDEKFEYPDPFDLNVDEWVIVYDECGMVLEDFAPFDDKKRERERVKRLRNPALMKSLAIIGVLRSKPDMDAEDARDLIGTERMLSLLASMAPEGDAVDPTPASPNETDEPSRESGDTSNDSSSPASPKSSDQPDALHAITGTDG